MAVHVFVVPRRLHRTPDAIFTVDVVHHFHRIVRIPRVPESTITEVPVLVARGAAPMHLRCEQNVPEIFVHSLVVKLLIFEIITPV